MGRQWNTIIESLGPLSGGTMSINANLTEIEALLTTLQADVADGIPISSFIGVTDAPTLGADISGAFTYNFSGTDSAPPETGVQLGYKNEGTYVLTSSTSPLPTTTTGTITSGTLNSNLRDGSGNSITSTTIGTRVRLDVNLSSAGTTGSAVPTTANLYAGTDGTNLRAVSVDTNGRVNVNPLRGTTTIGTLTAGTTNGTLFATNSTRNYLLVQCTSGTVFIDTNGTASTANGIQLTSGQGITFEGSFIPTGAIAGITSTGTAQLIGRQG